MVRWSVGKHVIPRSSRANAFFGLSVRADEGRRVLMGHSVFKSHRVGGGYFCPDGYFGVKDKSQLALPFTDAPTLDKFAEDFRLQRTDESGLSVVVPWVDPEITVATLIDAVVRGYFYPILTGALTVTVETPEKTMVNSTRTGFGAGRWKHRSRCARGWGRAPEAGPHLAAAKSSIGAPHHQGRFARENTASDRRSIRASSAERCAIGSRSETCWRRDTPGAVPSRSSDAPVSQPSRRSCSNRRKYPRKRRLRR